MADQSVTLSAGRVEKLSLQENRSGLFTHKVTIKADDINDSSFTTDGDTVTATLFDTPADFVVSRAVANVTTAFATDGTLTVMVGTDGDPDNFIDAQDCKTAGPLIGAAGGVPVTETGSSAASSDTLVARFTTQGATGAPADITAGEVEIFLHVIGLNEF